MYTLLSVDDQEDLLELGKIFLESTGNFQVDTASSGTEALELLQKKTYDAVVADYQMDGMDGLDLLKSVRRTFGDLPYILFTGRGREEVVIEAINNGVDFYLQKGGDPRAQFTELSHKIRMAVERRRLNSLSLKNEARFREIVDHLPETVYEFDVNGRFTYINKTGLEAFGMTEKDLEQGLNVIDVIAPEDRERVKARLRDVMVGKALPRSEEYAMVRRDGTKMQTEAYSSIILQNNKPSGLRGFVIDTTERKSTDQELRLMKISVDHASDEVFWLDFEGTIRYVNDSGCRNTGYSRDELLGMKIFELDPDFNPDVWVNFAEELRKKKTQLFQTRHKKKDGSIIDVEIMANYVSQEGREYSFAFVRDITNRRYAETELRAAYEQITAADEELQQQYDELKKDQERIRESEEHYRTLFESAGDAIFLVGDGVFQTFNAKTLEIFGCKNWEEMIGRSPLEFSPDYQPDGCRSLDAVRENDRSVLDGASLKFMWVHKRLDGTPFEAEVSLNRVTVGGRTLIQSIVRDISDRRQAENSVQLANKKLCMMNDVSRHVIRNKITGLMGIAEMTGTTGSPDERAVLVGDMKDLIRDIQREIDFTQEYQEIGINEPGWQNLHRILDTIDTSRIGVTFDIGNFEVYADPLLETIFEYLTENSVRHSVKGTAISITAREKPEGLNLTFSDNGVGIPKSFKEKIFERKPGDQRGVGLFLVREILGITGISITETGIPGEGARFEIMVPPGGYRLVK